MSKLIIPKNWSSTKDTLREALEPLRSARLVDSAELPNALHHSLFAREYGATTGPLAFGGELKLDYVNQKIEFVQDSKQIFSVKLNLHSQKSLFNEVQKKFSEFDIRIEGYKDKLSGSKKFKIDNSHAEQFAQLQWRVNTALSRVKSHMMGPQTPLVLWPHGFDLSTVWFVDGMDERNDPQMNFGFSPGYAGIDTPYLYFYAWPVPQGLTKTSLPAKGYWNEVWSTPSAVFELDYFAKSANPDDAIVETLLNCYWDISPKLRKTK